MVYESINEPVEVRADFYKSTIQPRLLRWNERLYPLTRVTLIHQVPNGEESVFAFSVTDETNHFLLHFNASSLRWRLIELSTP